MEVTTKATNFAHAPRKVQPIAGLIRGRSVADAMVILEHTPRAAAKDLAKVIHSGLANAVNNNNLTEASLKIKSIDVGTAQRLKRYRPASRGRALPYQKRTSFVNIIITGETKAKKPAKAKAETKKADQSTKKEDK